MVLGIKGSTGLSGCRRWRLRVVALLAVLVLGCYVYVQAPSLWLIPGPARGAMPVPDATAQGPRLLILAPHPDDDVLAVGGTLAQAAAAGEAVLVVYLTSGDANKWSKYLITWNPFGRAEDYRALGIRREKEASHSLGILGVHPKQAIFLRYPDEGLRALWSTNWSEARPYRSPFTRRSAPPAGLAFTSGTVYCGQDLLEDLVKIILAFRPTIVYLPHPGDAHPDHQAASLFGQAAVSRAQGDDPLLLPPEIRAYLVHAEERNWPSPEKLRPSLAFDTSALRAEGTAWQEVPLSPPTEKLKLRAVRAHLSQDWFSGARFFASFIRSDEIYQPLHQTAGGLSPATSRPR